MLSSWSCKPRKEPSKLYLHLTIAGGSASQSARLRLISIAGDYGQALLAPELLPEIVPLLESPNCMVIGHDLLSDMVVIRRAIGRRLGLCNLWDCKLAMQMLNNGLSDAYSGASLQAICRALLGWNLDDSPKDAGCSDEPSLRQMDFASRASSVLERIYAQQKALIEMRGMTRVAKVEFEVLPALVEIEHNGIGFDAEKGRRLLDSKIMEKDELEGKLERYAKSKKMAAFSPRNPAHVRKLLRSQGYYLENTSAAALEGILLKNPEDSFINLLLKYRELRQHIGFLKNWTNFARENRIYPKLEQLGGRSGRITCSSPNIQQVPREPRLKGLFIAAPGMSFVEANFSAIEMRLVAALSGDEAMIKIFKKGLDPHKQTAQAIFQKEKISDEERQIAKTLNYGTIYGGGANMVLSKLPKLTEDEAREFLNRFYRSYPGLKRWQQEASEGAPTVVIDGQTYKISKSALGRIRYVDPRHRNALINTPVQASGADLQKIALGRIYEKLTLPKYSDFRLINAVHDSILLEVPHKRAKEASKLLKGVMEQAGNEMLKVIPCETDAKMGKDWSFKNESRFGLGKIFSKAVSMIRRRS